MYFVCEQQCSVALKMQICAEMKSPALPKNHILVLLVLAYQVYEIRYADSQTSIFLQLLYHRSTLTSSTTLITRMLQIVY